MIGEYKLHLFCSWWYNCSSKNQIKNLTFV